jgi:hypothetical protein
MVTFFSSSTACISVRCCRRIAKGTKSGEYVTSDLGDFLTSTACISIKVLQPAAEQRKIPNMESMFISELGVYSNQYPVPHAIL